MERQEVLDLFKRYGAFLEGHFLLTSGLHSPHYFQCARVLQHPEAAEKLGRALGDKIKAALDGKVPTAVISPALGGLIIGHELGRALGCRAIFVERVEGSMHLRRFDLEPGERVVVVEDVVTTGGSFLETVEVAEKAGSDVLAACCLIDRSGGERTFSPALTSLVKVEVINYRPEDCPLCSKDIPLVKPGSRRTGNKGS